MVKEARVSSTLSAGICLEDESVRHFSAGELLFTGAAAIDFAENGRSNPWSPVSRCPAVSRVCQANGPTWWISQRRRLCQRLDRWRSGGGDARDPHEAGRGLGLGGHRGRGARGPVFGAPSVPTEDAGADYHRPSGRHGDRWAQQAAGCREQAAFRLACR